MATIVTRAGKGSALTHSEVDANFTNLNSSKLEGESGTYTPTITNATNVTSSSISDGQYVRVGNVVTASAKFAFTPTAAGFCAVRITLPIATNMTGDHQLAGAGAVIDVGNAYPPISAYADTTNDRAELAFYAPNTNTKAAVVHFTYVVI